MGLNEQEVKMLTDKIRQLRKDTVDTVFWAGGGHIGGSMSMMEIMVLLYYKYLNIKPSDPQWSDRDRFVLSKGHCGVGFAPILADKGYFDKELLKTFNHTHSKFAMHLDSNKCPGVDVTTGSLGHGLPMSVGLALGARLQKKSWKVYCLLGDGECDEGSVWEAAMSAAHYKLTNLITIVDRNKCMIDGRTEDVMNLEPFADKWRAFGFDVRECNGHDLNELSAAIEYAQNAKDKPVAIIAHTLKGKCISSMEDDFRWHYGAIDGDIVNQCKADIDKI